MAEEKTTNKNRRKESRILTDRFIYFNSYLILNSSEFEKHILDSSEYRNFRV
jgi:hypothetical protein